MTSVRLKLPPVYPITDVRVSGLSHTEQVDRFIRGGATLIQLREKHAGAREFYQEAKSAVLRARHSGVRVIINDRVDIALAVQADGVHLGQSDIPVDAARRLLGEAAIIGFSTHNLEQAELARSMPVNYVAFGPIFETATKGNPDPVVGLNALRQVRSILASIPLVAIGGITIANAREVFAAGADAVAPIAGLLTDPTRITENMSQILDLAQSSQPSSSV
jgi:thiamine-phosphate pyrophosphorylase